MNDNIKIGADIHTGDGSYTIGTQEKYDEFAKGRNQSLGKMRIRELAIEADIMAPTWNNVPLGYQKFAELIVAECIDIVENLSPGYKDYRDQIEDAFRRDCVIEIKEHFGVKE